MMIRFEDLKPGQVYSWVDTVASPEETFGPTYDIYIVGQDPRTGKWIGSCDQWSMEISELDEEDLRVMTLIHEHSNYSNGAPKWAPDGTLLDDKGSRSIFDDVDL